MIQINDKSFNTVFKRDAMMNDRKYAGGVIFANNKEDALRIAEQLVKDIKHRINAEKESDNDI